MTRPLFGRISLQLWRWQYASPGLIRALGWSLALTLVLLVVLLCMAIPDQGLLVKGF